MELFNGGCRLVITGHYTANINNDFGLAVGHFRVGVVALVHSPTRSPAAAPERPRWQVAEKVLTIHEIHDSTKPR
jgi:hypothetical protein